MTALPKDVVADLRRSIAELEQRLQSGLAERDEAIARQAAGAVENARLLSELHTSRDRQAASAEILRAIADASGDAQRSLQQIAETTSRLFGASSVTLNIARGDERARMIRVGASSHRVGSEVSAEHLGIGGRNLPATVFRENRQIHIPDLDNLDPAFADWPTLPHARAAGARAMAGTPLRREGKAIGALIVHRDRPVPFTDEELALLQSFADQAVIAIENARLFNETREALERQTASADILRVIASSPSDAQPVFEAIATTSNRLIGGVVTAVFRFVDGVTHLAAFTPPTPIADELLSASFPPPVGEFSPLEWVRNGEAAQVADTENSPEVRDIARARGYRSLLLSPLMSKGKPIGVISVTRAKPGTFADHDVQLLKTFADQAVIAIENVRLFNDTREALERQTATADILNVIASSPSDVQPVFKAIATSANKLIGGYSTAVLRFVGDEVHVAAFTPTNPTADDALKTSFPRPLADFPAFILVRDGQTVEFTDTESEDVPRLIRDLARLRGYRSMLFTPLISSGTQLGLISVTRKDPGSFAAHHVQLVRTFADQAVIAIENVRLFDEVQERTRELQESLEYQTATADVLNVISRSTTNVQAAFDAIAMSAA